MRWFVAVSLVVAGLMMGGEAAAQDWRAVVMQQLDFAGESVRTRGHTDANVLPRNQLVGVLESGGTSYVEVQLEQGVSYVFFGACDQDCSDLDLRLLKPDGFELLASDIETDDVPILEYVAPAEGAYLLGVDMADCSEEICYYGFRVYQQ
jgi:hypothetical protein